LKSLGDARATVADRRYVSWAENWRINYDDKNGSTGSWRIHHFISEGSVVIETVRGH